MLGNCEHELRIKGKSIDIKRILDYIVDGEFDFDKIIPEPRTKEECLNSCIQGFVYIKETKSNNKEDWFESILWREWFWKSEWKGIVTKLQRISENEVLICYNTYLYDVYSRLSGQEPIITKLQELYPDVQIKYNYKNFDEDMDVVTVINYTTENGWNEPKEYSPTC